MAILVEDQGTGKERIERYFLRCVSKDKDSNQPHGIILISEVPLPLDDAKRMAISHNTDYHSEGPDDGLVIIDLVHKLNIRDAYGELHFELLSKS